MLAIGEDEKEEGVKGALSECLGEKSVINQRFMGNRKRTHSHCVFLVFKKTSSYAKLHTL